MQFLATMEKLVLRYYNFFLEGVRNTLIIAFFAVLLGTLLGTLMAMARMSRIKPLKWIATAYIEFFRGTPLMVQLMFIFYGLPMIGVTFPSVSFIPDFDPGAEQAEVSVHRHRPDLQQRGLCVRGHPLRHSGRG